MNDPALSPLRVVDRGLVFEGVPHSDRQSCTFPGVSVLSDGRWICMFRAAPKKTELGGQRVLVSWSDDEGKNWTEPIDPFEPIECEGRPGSLRTGYVTELPGGDLLAALCWVDQSNPSLPFFNEKTEGLLDTRICLSRSRNRGRTWTRPEIVTTPPYNCPTPTTGPILLLKNGLLACQFETNKEYEDPSPWLHKSILQFSNDAGRSWPDHTVASEDPHGRVFYWDQRPGVLEDGRVLDLFWTFDRENEAYRNIHARESLDEGLTWSGIWDNGVPGQPASPVSLGDGRIAMVYVDRTGPPIIKVRVSDDLGRTWNPGTETILWKSSNPNESTKGSTMNEAWSEMSRFSVGLPATAPLADGGLLTVFYAGKKTDSTSIHWVRVSSALERD